MNNITFLPGEEPVEGHSVREPGTSDLDILKQSEVSDLMSYSLLIEGSW